MWLKKNEKLFHFVILSYENISSKTYIEILTFFFSKSRFYCNELHKKKDFDNNDSVT